jgi:hypothetical protein
VFVTFGQKASVQTRAAPRDGVIVVISGTASHLIRFTGSTGFD